ncbi:hypothetical protein SAMN05216499_13060 [Actinacidiphila paucisporea]|uniref:Uncharacterized protein n=1 Tax=Actinacidiphila paucisporea TaxID=310782 RepID=A0A1M7Q8W5_9ACTN|nr:hypothetical protein SAMN05216499_13060 [Actinacidiphila paucisporea]
MECGHNMPNLREKQHHIGVVHALRRAVWRTGNHEQALTLLTHCGRVHVTETANDALTQRLAPRSTARARWDDRLAWFPLRYVGAQLRL